MNRTELFKQFGMAVAMYAQKADLTDQEALQVKGLQKVWKVGEDVVAGERRQYNDKLYKCRQDHTTQADWTPDVYRAGWEVIDEAHAGTLEDPIPYSFGMALENGKYYSEDDILYLCSRDTGQAVYQKLSELTGIYVETV